MSKIAELKQKARSLEQREQWKPALEIYSRLVADHPDADELDVGLWNRIGDLHMRLAEPLQAVVAYERAVQAYSAAGLHNNALALCNKILRITPDRPGIYLKLGLISARKGFVADARSHLGRYVELMQRAEQLDEALQTLLEAVDGQHLDAPDVRRVIAEQLAAHGRETDAEELLPSSRGSGDAEAIPRLPESAGPGLGSGPAALAGSSSDIPRLDVGEVAELDLKIELDTGSSTDRHPQGEADDGGIGLVSLLGTNPADGAGAEIEDIEPLEGFVSTSIEADDAEEGTGLLPLVTLSAPEVDEEPYLDVLEVPTLDDAGLELYLPEPEVDTLDEEWSLQGASLPLLLSHVGDDQVEMSAHGGPHAGSFASHASELPPLDGPDLLPDFETDNRFWTPEPPQPSAPGPERDPLGRLRAGVAADPHDASARDALAAWLARHGCDPESVSALEAAVDVLVEQAAHHEALTALRLLLPLQPTRAALYRRQVELAVCTEDAELLTRAYLDLAGHLQGESGPEKARAVFERVLELDPGNVEARAALGLPSALRESSAPDGGYVDLAALIMEDDLEVGSTRFVVEAEPPSGDEDQDFAEVLARFRQQVSRNIASDDAESHYDLGVAFKEMGLFEEAVAEFQSALRAGANPLATVEMLGESFVAAGQPAVAWRILDRAVRLSSAADAELVGLLYWTARCHELLGRSAEALDCYERVLGVDIRFRDVAERMPPLRGAGALTAF
jgi:tetratricopeptide (TPR) repeat protein